LKLTAPAEILLVDDEREFVAILIQRLAKRNCSVTTASDGKEALAQLERDQGVEVVILDVNMPGLNGKEKTAVDKLIPRSRGPGTGFSLKGSVCFMADE
jgi:CheY-like chemotaxis protein